MKVLQVITSLRIGGAERLALELVKGLRARGEECNLVIFDGTRTHLLDEAENFGIRPIILGSGSRAMYSPANIFTLRTLMQGYDIVHTHNFPAQLFTALGRKGNCPVLVTTEHNTTNRRRGRLAGRLVDKYMYARYACVICCGEGVRGEFVSRYPEIPATLIPNGIDLAPYLSLPAPRGKNILMVSAFRPQKDHATALRALALLPRDVTLTFAGDGQTRTAAEQLCRELGLTDRVKFTGNVSDIPSLYADAAVALLSTHYEGFSLTTIEALASGRPLVASDVPGVRENVGDASILVPEGDAEAMANAIKAVIEGKISRNGREKAKEFDIRNTINQYIDNYKSLI